ncbi:MAG: hypothetical protein VCC00_04385 [Deltaproteobacteria bacterium]
MTRKYAFRSALILALFLGWAVLSADAGTYIAGELPAEFTNPGERAWIPTDPAMLKNEMKISKESAKLTQRIAKCYQAGARNYSQGKPTRLTDCLAKAREKYLKILAKVEAKAPGLPLCHDYSAEPDLAEAYLQAAVGDLLCASPAGAYIDGPVLY